MCIKAKICKANAHKIRNGCTADSHIHYLSNQNFGLYLYIISSCTPTDGCSGEEVEFIDILQIHKCIYFPSMKAHQIPHLKPSIPLKNLKCFAYFFVGYKFSWFAWFLYKLIAKSTTMCMSYVKYEDGSLITIYICQLPQ